MNKRIDTVVIGGGQAGLSISYFLKQQNREHVVLEKNSVGESWKSKKWDSFTLVTPNWQLRLPGFPYNGNNPDDFLSLKQVIKYLEDYVEFFNPPLRLGVEVFSVEALGDNNGFILNTNSGKIEASNVVVAAGTFQKPKIPEFSNKITSEIIQIHSSLYRNPEALPSGNVLVVGSGQSGCQIAEEINESGRKVFLCTSNVPRVPRKYRGKDFTFWLGKLGIIDRTVDELPSPAERFKPNPQVSGKNGGHTLNLHQFAKDGIVLLGRMKDADGTEISLEDNLKDNLAAADKFEKELKMGIDQFIEKSGMDAPNEEIKELTNGYDSEIIKELDLQSENINIIIWATGYSFNFNWIKFPIFDEFGYPIQKQGVTEIPGLYFLGLHWLHKITSGLFAGVGEDAEHIASHIINRS